MVVNWVKADLQLLIFSCGVIKIKKSFDDVKILDIAINAGAKRLY